MEKVSVIIPVHNSERFIRQCIQSVQNQAYDSLDILIIDDGSVDRSLEICRELERDDRRIRIVRQENRGASAARNRGLELAVGEYIFFLDSDDVIHPKLIGEGVKAIGELQADLALCRFVRVEGRRMQENAKHTPQAQGRAAWELLEGKKLEEQFHVKKRVMLQRIGGLLVRRSSVGRLRFKEGLLYGEDTLFMYQLLCAGARMAYSGQPWYYYRMNPDSVCHQQRVIGSESFFQCAKLIRDSELQKGHLSYALFWEGIFLYQIKRAFLKMKQLGDEAGAGKLKKEAEEEIRAPLFGKTSLRKRTMFWFCFYLTPLYMALNRLRPLYNKVMRR